MSSSSSDDDCYDERKKCKPKCTPSNGPRICASSVSTRDLTVTSCLLYQGEQADPEAMRLPVIMSSTINGDVPIGNNNSVFLNNFMSSPNLPFPSPTQIPQGMFKFDGAPFYGSKLPNFVSILESQSCSMIDNWRATKEIWSKIYLINLSGTVNYNVCFVLIIFSYNGYNTRVEILDIDVKTLMPSQYNTFKVNWQRGTSILPIQSDAIQVVIQTSVMLVNTSFNSVALNDIQTFNFLSQALRQKILLAY
jgi:hypothetical protein